MSQPHVMTSPQVSDEIRRTTCYMCACRCGINVHLKDGRVSYIEGNRDHPINKGVLCAKGASGIMQVTAPSRLRSPMRRVGPRGSGAFEEISWDEALELAVSWLKPLRETAPEKLAFFTGRDQSQSLTGWWAQNYGTPNYAAHGGFCSVNMAAGGIYTIGGAFWEFGQPDWERTELFVMFGVAEDHDSNPIKIGLGRLKARGVRVISVNPVRTGYSAVADDWYGITPGTDGLLILSLLHCLFEAGRIDLDYLAQWTNAAQLVTSDGLLRRDAQQNALVIDKASGQPMPWQASDVDPDLGAEWQGDRTVFRHMVEEYLKPEHAPEAVAARCGIPAPRIRALAAELAAAAFERAFTLPRPWVDFRGRQHAQMQGRPVSFHAMRGISAHSNGFQTARALHLLQIVLGSVEAPGGYRLKPPYPKPVEAHPKPHFKVTPGQPLNGPHLGYVRGPEDLALDADGRPVRIDKAFSWEAPLSAHGLMHMLIPNAHAGDPYRIDTLMLYMANMSWNSSMNAGQVMQMLTDRDASGDYVIPRIIYSDAYASEMVAYADLILPDTTYLERHDCISLLDRPISEPEAAGDCIRWPVVEPERPDGKGVRGFQSVLLDLGARLGLPGMVEPDGRASFRDYADYITRHQRRPGIGPLMGWRGADGQAQGRGAPNPEQLARYIENGGFYQAHIPESAGFFKPWNAGYQDWAVELGLYDSPQPYAFQIWSEPLRRFQAAAEGYGPQQPPEHLRARLLQAMTPLPSWYPPHGDSAGADYPVHALTQRPMAMYHSWGSQNAWLRQIHGKNDLYLPTALWQQHGFQPGDHARVSSPNGSITVPVAHMAALNPQTVWTWNAIGKRKGTWALAKDAPEAVTGFLLNHLISELQPGPGRVPNSDPVTGQAAWFDQKVRIERVARPSQVQPQFPALQAMPHEPDRRSATPPAGIAENLLKFFGFRGTEGVK